MTTAKPAAPRGLGRGLSALLGDAPPAQEAQGQRGNGARLIAIDLLGPNPFQPRRQFDETDLRELTESVRANGILQPIVVRPDPRGQGRFQIVAGERRWRSAQRAGLHEVPVVVRDFTDDQSLEVAIVENVQRAGLNSIEEALGYQALIDRFGYTQDKLAENVGKDALKNFYTQEVMIDSPGGAKLKPIYDMYKAAYPELAAKPDHPQTYMPYGIPPAMSLVKALQDAGPNPTREKVLAALKTQDFDSGVMAGRMQFGPEQRAANRSTIFIKYDGTTMAPLPGVFTSRWTYQAK